MILINPPYQNPTNPPYYLAELIAYLRTRGYKSDTKLVDWNLSHFYDTLKNHQGLIAYFKNPIQDFHSPTYFKNANQLIGMWQDNQDQTNTICQDYLQSTNKNIPTFITNFITQQQVENFEQIAISLTYHFSNTQSQFFTTMALAKAIKTIFPKKPILLGGTYLNHIDIRQLMTTCSFIDICFVKESEESFLKFLQGSPKSTIPNIFYRENHQILQNKINDNLKRKTSLLNPDLSYLSFENYLTPFPIITLQYKRGCAYNKCAFCSHNQNYFGYEKKKSTSSFADKLSYLSKNGIQHFYFADQYISPTDIDSICDEIIKHQLNIFWTFMARPHKQFTSSLLEKMKAAGCCWITWGLESGSARMQKVMKKNIDLDTAKQNIVTAHLSGIQNVVLMIQGFPGETKKDFQLSVNFLTSVSQYIYDYSMSPFTLCSGSYIFDQPEKYNIEIKAPQPIIIIKNNTINSNVHDFNLIKSNFCDYSKVLPPPKQTIPFAEHMLLYSSAI